MVLEINMDMAQAQQFRDKWQVVEEIHQKEALRSTLELRWQKLNSAFGIGKGLQLESSHSDEMRVYQRWAKLKKDQPKLPKA